MSETEPETPRASDVALMQQWSRGGTVSLAMLADSAKRIASWARFGDEPINASEQVGSEVREEWGVRWDPDRKIALGPTERDARQTIEDWTRLNLGGPLELVRRTVTTTAWQVAE